MNWKRFLGFFLIGAGLALSAWWLFILPFNWFAFIVAATAGVCKGFGLLLIDTNKHSL